LPLVYSWKGLKAEKTGIGVCTQDKFSLFDCYSFFLLKVADIFSAIFMPCRVIRVLFLQKFGLYYKYLLHKEIFFDRQDHQTLKQVKLLTFTAR